MRQLQRLRDGLRQGGSWARGWVMAVVAVGGGTSTVFCDHGG